MHLLLMCVGLNDPYNARGESGPCLDFCRLIRKPGEAARVYLLSTADAPGVSSSTQGRGEQLCTMLSAEGWYCYHRPMPVRDPTDYSELFPVMLDAVREVLGEPENADAEVIVNVSPGTGQMEAVWITLVASGYLRAALWQVKAPADELEELRRLRPVDFGPLVEPMTIDKAWAFLAGGYFGQAAAVLQEAQGRTLEPAQRARLQFLRRLCDAYHHWDQTAYTDCLQILEGLQTDLPPVPRVEALEGLKELLRGYVEELGEIVRSRLGANLTDLFQMARRRRAQRTYREAIWGFWLVYEVLVVEKALAAFQMRYGLPKRLSPDSFGFDFARTIPSDKRDLIKSEMNWVEGPPAGALRPAPRVIGSSQAVWILTRLFQLGEDSLAGDQLVANLGDITQKVEDARTARGGVVHGRRVVEENDVDNFERTLKDILTTVLGTAVMARPHPLSPESLENIRNALGPLLRM